MSEKLKPENLNFQYKVGDVVRLTTGQNAVILGYGIYDGQYFCVKHYEDGVHMGSARYLFSTENSEAYKSDIVRLESAAEKTLRVLGDYVREDMDLVAKVAAWNRCDPEPMTNVVRWTRYDGTPETLPEEGVAFFLVCNGLLLRQSYSFHSGAGQHEVVGDILPSPRNFKVGDLWAYLPQQPEGAE